MKKIVFCDIDGTLIKGIKKTTKKNIQAISEYVNAGGKFILTTGRSIVGATRIQEQINEILQKEQDYIICSNGGYVIDNINKTIEIHHIDEKICRVIYDKLIENKLWGLFYTEEADDKRGVYAMHIWFWFLLKMFKSLNPIKIRKNTNLTSFKIVVTSFSKKKIQQFVNILENEFKTKVSFTYTGKHIVEINALGISKASAAELIIQKEKLTKKDAASIGDSGNDVALFDVTSLPIAVKTKNETVINHTKHHIPKFKNAVAIAIKKYII